MAYRKPGRSNKFKNSAAKQSYLGYLSGENAASSSIKEIEPNKVFIGNLRSSVTRFTLKEHLEQIVTVKSAFIVNDVHTRLSKGYGFVSVQNNQDVQKLLKLSRNQRYLHGQCMIIKRAFKNKKNEIEELMTCSKYGPTDEAFDLDPQDPSQATIHHLCDDNMWHIFSYLTSYQLIGIERVCRRWQYFVYDKFSSIKEILLSDIMGRLPQTIVMPKKAILKYMILTGENLEHITLDHSTIDNFVFQVIGRFCKSLKIFNISLCDKVSLRNLHAALPALTNLTSFLALGAFGIDDRALQLIVNNCKKLEEIKVLFTRVTGKYFNELPSTMKKLYCGTPDMNLEKDVFKVLSERCSNLETLIIMNDDCFNLKHFEKFGKSCINLKEFTINLDPIPKSEYKLFALFKNLKVLDIHTHDGNIHTIFQYIPNIESLRIEVQDCFINENSDFSLLPKLNKLFIRNSNSEKALSTLINCKNLQKLLFSNYQGTLELLCKLIKNCPKLNTIECTSLQYDGEETKKALIQATKERTEFLSILMRPNFNATEPKIETPKFKIELLYGVSNDSWEDDSDNSDPLFDIYDELDIDDDDIFDPYQFEPYQFGAMKEFFDNAFGFDEDPYDVDWDYDVENYL